MISKNTLLLSVATLILIVLSYLLFDQSIALWCHTHLRQTDKEIFIMITQFGESTVYLIGFALGALLFHFYWKQPLWANRLLFLFAAVAVSGIIADIIKVIAGRYRPSELFDNKLYGFDFFHLDRALTSFPSGHTATAFALAMAISYLWPRLSPMLWIAAVAIGISRIAIGAHFPSDVLGGALTGVLSVSLILYYWKQKPNLAL